MSRFVVLAVAVFASQLMLSCEAAECVKMRECCAQIAEDDWVGDACGPIAAGVHDPQSCAAVVSAIKVAAEDRSQTLPQECE